MPGRRKQSKPTAEQRRLAAQWEAIKASHASPLERGAKSWGLKKPKQVKEVEQIDLLVDLPVQKPMKDPGVATKPVIDPLAEIKARLKSRVGQAFNKGGLQYLTDDELEEQRSGSHRRRG